MQDGQHRGELWLVNLEMRRQWAISGGQKGILTEIYLIVMDGEIQYPAEFKKLQTATQTTVKILPAWLLLHHTL